MTEKYDVLDDRPGSSHSANGRIPRAGIESPQQGESAHDESYHLKRRALSPDGSERVGEDGENMNPESHSRRSSTDFDTESMAVKPEPVTWRSLPRKDQLLLLALARLSEPLTQTSLSTYMFYQLRSFDPSLSDSVIASQAGVLQGAFTGAQFLTAILWGRVADAKWGGRKPVLLIGLFGTAISVIGYGFSKSFVSAVTFRVIGGMLNGNIGVLRTMISEIVKEKKYQSRAFVILPMTFNMGVLLGPLLGGILADPVGSYPRLFGPNSLLGGSHGVWWMKNWPYALPNILSAVFLVLSALGVMFGLEETHELLQSRRDYGLICKKWIVRNIFRREDTHDYTQLAPDENESSRFSHSFELQSTSTATPATPASPKNELGQKVRQKLPFRRIWTKTVIFTLLSHSILAFHIGTFNSLWFTFLSTPRFDPTHPEPPSLKVQNPPLNFTGGLALLPRDIGIALAILGAIGITLNFTLYPVTSSKLGITKTYRASLLFFPITYTLTPFLALIPSTSSPPHPSSGFLIWAGIIGVLIIQVFGRTFAIPCTTILINNCCPHPSVLGTIHGMGQTVSSAARTFGPIIGGLLFGQGLRIGVVGTALWFLAGVALLGAFAGTFVKEGSGHEILLEGEEREG